MNKQLIKPPYVILSGPNSCGKTTQGSMLAQSVNQSLHTDMSKLIRARAEIDEKFKIMSQELMCNGGLLPCHIVSELFREHVEAAVYILHILTGYPRTLVQATSFIKYMNDQYGLNSYYSQVIVIDNHLSEEDVLVRAAERRQKDIGAGLEPRPDDDPEVVVHRYKVFEMETVPLLHYFNEIGVTVAKIDAKQPVGDVHSQIKLILKEHSML